MTKRFLLAVAGSLAAVPALAHEGAHMHPHGAEGWLALAAIAVAIAGAAVLWRSR
jgi:hypothetical protein